MVGDGDSESGSSSLLCDALASSIKQGVTPQGPAGLGHGGPLGMEVMDPWGQQRAASLLCPLSGHLPGHRGDLGDRGSEWSLCTLHTSAPALTPPLLTSPRALLRACGADAMPLRWRFVLLFSLTSYYCLVLVFLQAPSFFP